MKSKISFIWQGINGRYGHWQDGLWLAMKHLEKEYDVTYHDLDEDIPEDSIIFFWEAPCNYNGQFSEGYKRIMNLPNKKVLLFAGGPIKKEWVEGFDLVCVESKINADEFTQLGVPNITAFGINEEVFKPLNLEKKYQAIHQGTCASWKRQWLVGEAFKDRALLVGRFQKSDSRPFNEAREYGATILDEQPYPEIAKLLNESDILAQTADYWGGGQRATLEAMACGIPVICMSDSPKNREYVEESGAGLVCEPDAQSIKKAYEEIMTWEDKQKGIEYVKNKWTSKHYAESLRTAINLCQKHQ